MKKINNNLTFSIAGTPPSDNTVYRSRKLKKKTITYMTKEAREWKDTTIHRLVANGIGQGEEFPLDCHVEVRIDYYFKMVEKEVKRDVQNYDKLLLDSLNGIVWVDDSQVQQAVLTKHLVKDNSRTEVVVEWD